MRDGLAMQTKRFRTTCRESRFRGKKKNECSGERVFGERERVRKLESEAKRGRKAHLGLRLRYLVKFWGTVKE